LLNDLRYAIRFLARRRLFTLVAVVTVALGVGANTAVFSLADSVLFRPLPYAYSDRLFVLEPVRVSNGQNFGTMSFGDLQAAREAGVFDRVMDLDPISAAFMRDGDRLESLRVLPVPREYLETLGVRPLYGRDFNDSDVGQRAVMLTYRTWVGRFGANSALLDASIPTVDGAPIHVVGVLPPSFRAFFSPPDMLSLTTPSNDPGSRASLPIARLAAGVTREAAQARLSALTATELKPGVLELRMIPLRQMMGRASSRILTLLCAAAFLVLLVGCANLASLVLARGAERRRELAVRASLGGSQWRLARLLLVETVVVAVTGGTVGLAVAYWSFGLLTAKLPAALAQSVDPVFDVRAFLFAAATALAAGVISGIVPAWRLASADARAGLQRGGLQPRASRTGRKALLSFEVGVAVVAVVAAFVLGRSLSDLIANEMGFDATRLVVSGRFVGVGASTFDRPARAAQFSEQLDAVRALPEVRSAAAITILPASGAAPDLPLFPRGAGKGGVRMVSGGFFRTMGIPLLEGRELDDRESFAGTPVGVLNQSAARVLFPEGGALGRPVSAPGQPTRTVIGIAADWRESLKEPAEPTMYVPFDRAKFRGAQMIVDAVDVPSLRERISSTINRVTPDSSVRAQPISALLDREVESLRFTLIVIGAFASLTVLLSVLGVYGVIAFIAAERTREYGVRVALGATRRVIGALVIRQALVPVATGLAAGLIAAIWASRLLAAQLLDIVPAGPVTFAAAAMVLLVAGLAASALPARRAARVDPMVALRAE
jgi:predicted permease